jgi:hypothetical protein
VRCDKTAKFSQKRLKASGMGQNDDDVAGGDEKNAYLAKKIGKMC